LTAGKSSSLRETLNKGLQEQMMVGKQLVMGGMIIVSILESASVGVTTERLSQTAQWRIK